MGILAVTEPGIIQPGALGLSKPQLMFSVNGQAIFYLGAEVRMEVCAIKGSGLCCPSSNKAAN